MIHNCHTKMLFKAVQHKHAFLDLNHHDIALNDVWKSDALIFIFKIICGYYKPYLFVDFVVVVFL